MVRLLICGDRNWTNKALIKKHIMMLRPDVVIEGEASGADSMGRDAAIELGISVKRFPANWGEYGRAAGPIRNQQMLNEGKPNIVYAFHNNISESKGTKDMVNRARKAGIKTVVIKE
jgi:hypothetical protein